jgi:hypothetical protein
MNEYKMSRTFNRRGEMKRNHFENSDVDKRIILKWSVRMWTRFNWLKRGFSGGLLWTRKRTFGFY